MAGTPNVPAALLKTIECSVCLLTYNTKDREGLVLDCGHTFCKHCISNLTEDLMVKCPTCRKENTTENLKKNYTVLDIVTTLSNKCTQSFANNDCSHCCLHLCDTCLGTHLDELRAEVQQNVNLLSNKVSDVDDSKYNQLIADVDSQAQDALDKLHQDLRDMHDDLDSFEKAAEKSILELKEENIDACNDWKVKCAVQAVRINSLVQIEKLRGTSKKVSIADLDETLKACTALAQELAEVTDSVPPTKVCHYHAASRDKDWYKLIGCVNSSDVCSTHGKLSVSSTHPELMSANKASDHASSQTDTFNTTTIAANDTTLDKGSLHAESTATNKTYDSSSQTITAEVYNNSSMTDSVSACTESATVQEPIAAASSTRTIRDYQSARVKRVIGRHGCGRDQFNHPWGIAVSSGGDIVISDHKNHRIKVYDSNLQLKTLFGRKGSSNGQLINPTGICLNSNDDIFICDSGNNRIQICSLDGQFKDSFKIKDRKDHITNASIAAITCDVNGLLYICDQTECCIRVFTQNGWFVRNIGTNNLTNKPVSVAVTKTGTILVSGVADVVSVFNSNCQYVESYPNHTPRSLGDVWVNGIAFDPEGNILLADSNNRDILMLDEYGKYKCTVGSFGQLSNAINRPLGLTVNKSNNILLCNADDHNILVLEIP